MPGARSTRDGDTGNEDNSSFARFFKLDKWAMFSFVDGTGNAMRTTSFARFFKLDKYAMFSFAMTSGLASDSDKFKMMCKNLADMPYKN